jgi:hypothetical protein
MFPVAWFPVAHGSVAFKRIALASPGDLVPTLSKLLHRLIREEGVPPGDVAILTGHALGHSGLDQGKQIGIFPITRDPGVAQIVCVQTIHRFKGLERSVVILADVDGLGEAYLDQLMYVGLTRARGHVVVATEPCAIENMGDVGSQTDNSGHRRVDVARIITVHLCSDNAHK